ncbi:MAG TPA: OmpA family protein [Polyangiales bacterium]|nr:OmpA family protein [Polyangiales bacterium]
MTLNIQQRVGASLLLASTLAIGCATAQPSKELIDAREAYSRAEKGKAAQYNPAAVHEAKTALQRAEQAFEDDPDSDAARDDAYIALRRAERAEVEASTMMWQQRQEKARADASQAQAKGLQKAESELAATREQLQQEKAAREQAEAKAKETLAKLAAANAAAVKEEPRGTVITLAGGVLFASNKSTLLPGAQQSLDQIADALKEDESKKILIEGHTDSRGSDTMNQQLSKARADAVAAYFKTRGVADDRLTTAGLGESRPVADNNTAEGRANNRRVEIVIQNAEPK